MALRHLIVHMDGGERAAERLHLAVGLAARFGARLAGLFADAGEPRPAGRSRRRWRELEHAVRAAFETAARAAGVPSEWWTIEEAELEPGGVAARYARYGDLTLVGQDDPEARRVPADFAARVLLESGGPVLVVPFIGRHRDVGRRVVVAWDGSREAARALHDALPLMIGAETVQVALLHRRGERVTPDHPGRPGVARYLGAHGVTAEYAPVLVDEKGRGVGAAALDAILNVGSDLGADLLVMGARGRHGVPFPRAARTTRASLASMTAPVLLSL